MKHVLGLAVLLAAACPLAAVAQMDTVVVQDYFAAGQVEGTLNTAVTAAISDGTISSKVFKLTPFGLYILNGTITVPAGAHLRLAADDPGADQNSAPPQIVWTVSGGITTAFIFDCFGDLTLKNIWILFANTAGTQLGTSIKFEDSPDEINGQHGTFDGCLFDYSQIGADGSGAISVTARHFRGKFTNCYFRNCSDVHYRYYGRAVSFPFGTTGWHTDSLSFENCTFTNLGYVLMQEGSEYSDHVSFNHCTFANTVMFGLESSWWYWLSVTNSVFLNMFMYGDIGENNGNPNGGTFAIDSVSNFGFTPPFTDQDRHILLANSSYAHDSWLTDYYPHNAYSDTVTNPINIPRPMPMIGPRTRMFFDTTDGTGAKSYPLMNRASLYEGANPNFLLSPTNAEAIKRYLYFKWTNNADTNWAYEPGASVTQTWPLPENLKVTNTTLRTAALGGYPLGDLYHWDKTRYNSWKAQAETERRRIDQWLATGVDPGPLSVEQQPGIPTAFTLGQNYPNPFNPGTKIDYSLPQSGHVSLKVYDLLGREVATLFDGEQVAGNYTATFDGAKLASGVYLYRLQSGTSSVAKKLVLMK